MNSKPSREALPVLRWLKDNWLSVGFIVAIAGALYSLGSLSTKVGLLTKQVQTMSESLNQVRTEHGEVSSLLGSLSTEVELLMKQVNPDSLAQIRKEQVDFLSLSEVLHYTIHDNNVEAYNFLERFLQQKPSKAAHLIALEIQARLIWDHFRPEADDAMTTLDNLWNVAEDMRKLASDKYYAYHWRGIVRYIRWQNDMSVDTLLKKAEYNFRKSITLFPDQFKDGSNLAEVLVLLGEHEQAQKQLRALHKVMKYASPCYDLIRHYLQALSEVLDTTRGHPAYDSIMKRFENCDLRCGGVYHTKTIDTFLTKKPKEILDSNRTIAGDLTDKMEEVCSRK